MALQFGRAPHALFPLGAAEGAPLRRAVGARQFYLQTDPSPTFATAHVPAVGARSSVGVLLCPPFGWSELCTHRSRRAWADQLAQAGHPALRIDLPATGDSTGSLSSARLLDAWISAVGTASAWLRDEFGCSRVCGLGIGLGGMLAWLAASDGAALDDLILWGVPARGRQLVRELRIAAQVDIDSQVESRSDGVLAPAPDLDEEGLLDEAGRVIPKGVLESLGAIDLRRVSLPDPEGRRALIFRREGAKSDEILEQQLRDLGVDVAVQDAAGYEPMMRYVQESVAPAQEIARSVAWLSSESAGSSRVAAVASADPDLAAESVEFIEDGVLIRETAVSISLPGGDVAAIITEPVDVQAANLCAVFSSGGSDRRIGPNRLWVDVARGWAAQGVTAVRFDPPGIGDSDGDERDWNTLKDHYLPHQVDRLREMLDALEARGLPSRFALVGFCSGAYRSVNTAVVDTRVAGVLAISLAFFRWTWWTVNIHDSWITSREPEPDDSAVKLRLIGLLQRGLTMAKSVHRATVIAGQPFPNRGERIVRRLTARGVELVLIVKGSSHTYEQLTMPRRRARVRGIERLHVNKIPGLDVRFRPVVSQRYVRESLDAAILRLLGAEAPASVTESSQQRCAA
jgi:pimeloyl-ACP methyl ester carboxylesterase